jgi:hypothetical protein
VRWGGTGTDERFFVHVSKKNMLIQKNLNNKNLKTKFLNTRFWDFAGGNAVHNIYCTFTVIVFFSSYHSIDEILVSV